MQVEGQHRTSVLMATGARVSNAYTTYHILRNSLWKRRVIPYSLVRVKLRRYMMGVRLIS